MSQALEDVIALRSYTVPPCCSPIVSPAGELPQFPFVEQHRAPVLKPDDFVAMDYFSRHRALELPGGRLSSHKVAGVREAIEAAGATLRYLPPYSPDFNPIEQVFAKFKALLRRTAARTVDGLWSTIGTLLGHFPPDECARYIRHAGYGRLG